ncbi:hypothetical protein BALH_0475 [Bacillus thuringiensis str. Al Hakam]|nr:hypothetical protein BALH_0475 [Bacillus thuringiensis str. Al Hakam]
MTKICFIYHQICHTASPYWIFKSKKIYLLEHLFHIPGFVGSTPPQEVVPIHAAHPESSGL